VAASPTPDTDPERPEAEPHESLWGGPGLALAALLALAAALRLAGIRYGLPFPLLNPDERNIVPRAWAMTHGAGADPHWFDYPSLLLYVLAPAQWWSDAPSYLVARLVVVALGVAGVAAAWWLGDRAYGTVAGAVAAAATAVATTHVAYSHMAVTDVPLTLGVTVSLALLVSGRLELGAVAAGLAAGFKYPGLLLAAPVVALAWGRWPRLALALGLMAVTFLATTPYAVVHAGEALGDVWRVQRLAREGWLGFEHDHWAGIAFPARLWDALGPALLVAVAGLVAALMRRNRADLVLASFVLVTFLDLLTARAHFDRYVLPLVPALGALAGRMRSLAPVTLLLLVVPLTWSIRDDRELLRTDTRVVAERWIREHVDESASFAVDPSTPPLDGYRVLALALPGPGRPFDENRDLAELRRRGVGYVLVTGAVTDRVLAARDRYPRESRFYDELGGRARRVYRLDPGGDLAGPWVAVYHLSS
jgi:hypothetical protein